ncbi:hypothetical protein Prudu_016502 [Prunus dulcis]|uniref:Non-ATPase subunit 9 n=1 Tax=Prunus dulcis TaxID=3755 RepID=A0A4Y1RMA5_PRUDU|nr:hypothetical protein Prudu_016502 [Prunus dulcis]
MHKYLIVFLSSSSSSLNAKDRSFSSCFHRTQKTTTVRQSFYRLLSVKMVSQQQTKDSGSKKLGIVAPQDKSSKEMKSSKKMKFASSSAETESQTTISDDSKTGRGMSTMPRVVKRKLQKVRPIVEYNKMGKGIGQAHIEMQSYIGVLARSRVPLVDKKWSQIPKDVKEQIWEAVDMAFVVGQGGKKSVLASAAKKWKDFKSTLTRHYILPYTNDKEKLSHPPETYKFIEKAQWDAFVASRLSQDFESVHSQHAQIREKLEYNHRLSRKGYAGLEDELEETMPGVEIDRSTLWKRARQDKHGNIPDPKEASLLNIVDQACALFSPSEWTDDLEAFILKGYEKHAPGSYEKARLRCYVLCFSEFQKIQREQFLQLPPKPSQKRNWRGNTVAPFGGNNMLVLYSCPANTSNKHFVQVQHNEHPIPMPIPDFDFTFELRRFLSCDGIDFCPLDMFKERIVAPHLKHGYNSVCNVKLEQQE